MTSCDLIRQPIPELPGTQVWNGWVTVPEHWEVAQVRRWFDIVNGGTPASGDDSYWGGETVWLTPDDLGRNSEAWISESRRRITDDGVSNSSARVSPEGSIILSTRAPIGCHIAITSVPAATNQVMSHAGTEPQNRQWLRVLLTHSQSLITPSAREGHNVHGVDSD